MEKTKMTIHRALAELKLIDAKIEKQISEINPVGIFQKDKLINGYTKESDFKDSAISKYQSVTDLIKRKCDIKSAVVLANGITKVKVGNKEMTIADAINFKSNIKFKNMLIQKLKQSHLQSASNLQKNNQIVEDNVQKLLEYTFGKESTKVNEGDMNAVRKPYIEANTWHLFDPLEVLNKIEAMEKEVSEFEMEIDAALSEINATTFIEI
jgi:hypothetical protein